MTTESIDRIVERDAITRDNLRSLTAQHRQGLITHVVFGNVRDWQVRAALRRHYQHETQARTHFNPVLSGLHHYASR